MNQLRLQIKKSPYSKRHTSLYQRGGRRNTRRFRHVKVGDKCLDVEGGSHKTGARVITYSCHSGPNQKFKLTRRGEWKAKHSGKCVNIKTFRQKVCRI